MPDRDGLLSGGLLGPTPNMGGFTGRYTREDPTSFLLPTQEELSAEKQQIEEEGGRGIFSTLFLGIERLFLGQALKRGIAESADRGVEGFLHGFASNAPIPGLGDPFRETRFTDIRKAFNWEQQPDDNAVTQFFLNLAGEIALSPLELAAAPMGKVGKMFSSSMGGLAAVNPSYFKAVNLGQRALVTFRVPFAGTYLGGTNFGLKAVPLAIGKGMDFVGGVMRTAPGLSKVTQFFSDTPAIFDPEKAAAAKEMVRQYKQIIPQIEQRGMKILTSQMDPETFKWAMSMSAADRRAVTTMYDLGLEATDAQGAIGWAVDHADLKMALLRRERMIATNPEYAKAWDAAKVLDTGIRTPEALAAVNKLYEKFPNVPLPEKWLTEIGKPGRPGAELSLFDQPILTPGGTQTGTTTGDVVREALRKNKEEIFDLLGRAKQGKEVTTSQLNDVLRAHRMAMEDIARTESLAGILNQSFETFAGPYAYRVLSRQGLLEAKGTEILGGKSMTEMIDPTIANTIHDTFLQGVQQMAGKEGVDAVGRFLQNRKLTDLPTVAANAIAYQIGLKATGHIPIKELEEFGAMPVWAKIFNAKKWREFSKIDPDLGEFFRIFPVHNDLIRYRDAAKAMQPIAYWKSALHPDSTLVVDSFSMKETQQLEKYIGDTTKQIVFEKPGGYVFPALSQVAEQWGRQSVTELAETQKYHIHTQVVDDLVTAKITFVKQMRELAGQLKLKDTAGKDEIAGVTRNGQAQIARALGDLQEAQKQLQRAQQLQSLQRLRQSGRAPELGMKGGSPFKSISGGEAKLSHGMSPNDLLNDSTLNAELDAIESAGQGITGQFIKTGIPPAELEQQALSGVKSQFGSLLEESSTKLTAEEKAFIKRLRKSAGQEPAKPGTIRDDLFQLGKQEQKDYAGLLEGRITPQAYIEEHGALPPAFYKQNPLSILLDMSEEERIAFARKYLGQSGGGLLSQKLSDAKELVASRNTMLTGVRDGLKQILDDMTELHNSTVKGYKGELKATKEAYKAKRQAVSAYEDSANAAIDSIKYNTNPAQFNDQLVQLLKQKDAGVVNAAEAAAIQLTKKVKGADGVVTEVPDGTLLDKIRERFPDTKAYVMHKEDHDALKELYERLSKPDFLAGNRIIRLLDGIKSVWSSHTTLNPLFMATRARDVAQNQMALAVDGIGGMYGHWKAWEAGASLRAAQKGSGKLEELMAAKTIASPTGEIPMLAVFERMQQRGLIGSPMYRDELLANAEQVAYQMQRKGKAAEWAKDIPSILGIPIRSADRSPFLQLGYKVAGHLDDHARAAGVFNAIHKGADVESAISMVEKTLYDSRRMMTNTERYTLGRLIPFYTFKKYAIERSVRLMMSRPGYASWFDKMQRLAYAATPQDGSSLDPAVIDTILPQFIKEGMGIPYRNTPDGPAFALFGSYSTLGDLNTLAAMLDNVFSPDKTAGDSLERYIGTQVHPVIRLMGENLRNKEYFNDRTLQAEGETASFFGIDMPRRWRSALRSIRFLNELDKLNVINTSEKEALIAAGRDRQDLPLGERLLGSAFNPFPVIPRSNLVDVTSDYRSAQQEDMKKYAVMKSRLKRKIEDAQITGEALKPSDVADLRQAMIRKGAEMQVREDVKKSYSIDEIMSRRAAKVGERPRKVAIPRALREVE